MRPWLGTFVDIAAEGLAESLEPAVEAAFAAIARVHDLMSFHAPESDVSRINRAGQGEVITIDPQTYDVLYFARHVADLSGGQFDVTIAPVLVDRGLLPDHGHPVPHKVSYDDLDLLPGCRTRWRCKGAVDLGGVAKGYAVDCAIAALRNAGLESGLVNAGGDMRCFGNPQPIHVRDPGEPARLIPLGFIDHCAIATSAGYFSAGSADALVDPRRGACESWQGSISVLASDCMTADALTKVVRLAPERVPALVSEFDAQALVIDQEGWRSCGEPRLRQSPWPS
jgi:thiamine biosynthesis lipoprotein